MFAIDTRGLPTFNSYEDARNYWAKIKPWRNDFNSTDRPLDSNRKKKHMGIRVDENESVICRLYSTDILTFYKDGRVKVKFYYSNSTQRFINELWRGAYVDMRNHVVWNQWQYWRGGRGQMVKDGYALFDTTGALVNGCSYKEPKLNVKRANALRKRIGFDKFAVWRAAFETLGTIQPILKWQRNNMSCDEIVEALAAGTEGWKKLATYMDNAAILQGIYQHHTAEVIDLIEWDAFASPTEFRSWRALCNKYHWVSTY